MIMANSQVFQTIYHKNFCISTSIKTTANFLITDIEMASFIARDCKAITRFAPGFLNHPFRNESPAGVADHGKTH